MLINSLNNERVKNWSKLNNKKYRDFEGLFLVEGDHLVKEAIKNNVVKEIIVLEEVVFDTSLPKFVVSVPVMKKITNQISISNICAVCYKKEERDAKGNILLLDEIQDPGNLGTIIRSAVAFNFDTVVLGDNCVDLYNDKTIRASEGMIFNINVVKRELIGYIKELKKNNYVVLGTNVTSGINVKEIEFEDNVALVLGNEGNGVKQEIQNLCDDNIYIKMNNDCESLNVGVAASILMYEISNKE